MRRVVLVRHGESELNALNRNGEKFFCGQFDSQLTERGKKQARAVGALLAGDANVRIRYAVSSVLNRAVDTLQIIANALPAPLTLLPPMPGFNERSLGAFEGKTEVEIFRKFPKYRDHPDYNRFRNDYVQRAPSGENLNDVAARVWAAWQDVMKQTSDDVLIVSHSKAIQTWVGRALGLPQEETLRLKIPHAAPIVVEIPEPCDHTAPLPRYQIVSHDLGIAPAPPQ